MWLLSICCLHLKWIGTSTVIDPVYLAMHGSCAGEAMTMVTEHCQDLVCSAHYLVLLAT
jgi:hypothetical protein